MFLSHIEYNFFKSGQWRIPPPPKKCRIPPPPPVRNRWCRGLFNLSVIKRTVEQWLFCNYVKKLYLPVCFNVTLRPFVLFSITISILSMLIHWYRPNANDIPCVLMRDVGLHHCYKFNNMYRYYYVCTSCQLHLMYMCMILEIMKII